MNDVEKNISQLYMGLFEGFSQDLKYLSLIASKVMEWDDKGVLSINTERLYDELVYYTYYASRDIKCPLSFFVPLILVSRSFQSYELILIDYLNKFTKFLKVENKINKYLLEIFTLDNIIRLLIVNKKFIKDDEAFNEFLSKLLENIKIYNPKFDKKIELVNFQIEKIKFIEDIYKLENQEFSSDFDILDILYRLKKDDSININIDKFEDEDKQRFYKYIYNYIKSEGTNKIKPDNGVESTFSYDFIKSMDKYIINFRNKKVGKSTYVRKDSKPSPRDFIDRNIGEQFVDPILNKSIIVDKKIEDNICKIKLDTKTGIYKFVLPVKKK